VRREDYVAPAGTAGSKPPVIDSPRKKQEAAEAATSPPKTPPKAGPTIKLAPLPVSEQPKAEQKPDEPAPQRPDLKLPADAIRASKAGSKPLAEHLRRHEKKRTTDETRKEGRTPVGTKAGPPADADQTARGAAPRRTIGPCWAVASNASYSASGPAAVAADRSMPTPADRRDSASEFAAWEPTRRRRAKARS
jgi:hypothetical protein